MNISNLVTFMAGKSDYTFQIIISYVVIAIIALFILFVILVNKGVIWGNKSNRFKRFITHPLFCYSLKRIGSAVFSILIALAITFCLVRMQDLRSAYCGGFETKYDEVEFERFCDSYMKSLGLSGSIVEQFFAYLYNILPIPKEVVVSINTNVPETDPNYLTTQFAIVYLGIVTPKSSNANPLIWEAIVDKMPISFRWSAVATILQIVIGYPLGVLMAKYQDKLIDKIGKTYIILVSAIPGLLYYYLLFIMFQQLDYSGFGFPIKWDTNNFLTWIAPAFTSAFAGISGIAYWVRRYMLNEINSDYVKYARAKGLSENKIMFKHVLRNAIVPLSRSLSTAFISCLFGSYFIERLFGIPGFGDMLMTAINVKDFMIVQGVVVVSAVLSVLSYLIADITMACLDPRISLTD